MRSCRINSWRTGGGSRIAHRSPNDCRKWWALAYVTRSDLARLGIADRLQSSLDPGLLANLADNAADRYSAVTSPCRSGAMTFGTAANIRSNASPVIGRPFIGTERASQQ